MFSTFLRNLSLVFAFTTGSIATRPTAWYASIHTADPGLTGANEMTTGTDATYARQAVTLDTPSGGQAPSTGDLTWNSTPGWTATHIGIWDAPTGGNFLDGGELAVPEVVAPSGTLVLPAGRLIPSLT